MVQTLLPIHYVDKKEGIRLDGYANTLVYREKQKNGGVSYEIMAVHFGGYPEHVKGMTDAVYGGGSLMVELPEGETEFASLTKQYERKVSREGVYAQAVLRIRDEAEQVIDRSGEESGAPPTQTQMEMPPRSCWIFTPHGDRERLFQEIDRRVRVPLIPEFQDYLLTELQRRSILTPLRVLSVNEEFDAWELKCAKDDKNIVKAVEDGLRRGIISIPGATPESEAMLAAIKGVSSYLQAFGVPLAERIQSRYSPLFDPSKEPVSDSILSLNGHIQRKAGYSLYDAQLAVAEAAKRKIDQNEPAMIIAECGSGKSKIGSVALVASHMDTGKSKSFNVILCPSHMTEKWVRELEEAIPNAVGGVIRSINSLKKFHREYEKCRDKHFFAVMSKEKARDGYMRRPAATYNRRLHAYQCPSCLKAVMTSLTEDGVKYPVPADAGFFRRENEKNHKCPECGSPLWAPLDDHTQSEWVKVPDWGFVHRQDALNGIAFCNSPKIQKALEEIDRNRDGVYQPAGAYRRFPISSYISKKMGKRKIHGFIADELQQYNNASGQGDAMAEIYRASEKFIGMTATLINGYASGIFNLLYRLVPGLMLMDNKRYSDFTGFCAEYGVLETVYETDLQYNANRRSVSRKLREKLLPGVSPLVYCRFLLENAVFLSLADMGKDLPEYAEIPVPVKLNPKVEQEYHRLEKAFRNTMIHERRIARKVMSAFMGLLTVYPDQPYGHKPIVNPFFPDRVVAKAADLSSSDELQEKDRQVLELVKRKTESGERVLIYTSWVRIDTQEKLLKLFTENRIRTAVLTAKVSPSKREAWLEKQVQNGIQVVICNPSIVETGLDLNAFTTLVYFNISYNLFTLRQSSRRSWRINQTAPRIEVYFFFYEGTIQHRAMQLMASKLAVASIIEGNMSDEGLAAMSDCRDLTSQLAKELTAGIRCEVMDLAEVFSKMEIRHSEQEWEVRKKRQSSAKTVSWEPVKAAGSVGTPASGDSEAYAEDVPARMEPEDFLFASPRRNSRKNAAQQTSVEGQLTLFGVPA